jgi:hypothetical protein
MTKKLRQKVKPKVIRHNCVKGKLTGWKWARTKALRFVLIKLSIPADAHVIRSSVRTGNAKHRASKAKVLGLWRFKYEYNFKYGQLSRGKATQIAYSDYDRSFSYKKGKLLVPMRDFNTDKNLICASGIHFYLEEQIALRKAW